MNIYIKVLLLFALVACQVIAHETEHGHKCTHDEKEHSEPEFIDIPEENYPVLEEGRLLASASKFRMYAYTGFLSGSFGTYMEDTLAPAVLSFFESALKVKYPVSGNLKLSSSIKSICGVNTPSVFKSGVSADYAIMFTSTKDSSGSWVAESVNCYSASGSKRPLIAKTELNTALFKNPGNDVLLHEKNIYLVLHEMTHTLGFSKSLYKYWLDENGNTRKGHVKSGTIDGSSATLIDASPITNRMRNFFGCSSIKGAYMENSGSSATAGSHFERRHFVFEAMSSGLIYQQAYSQFSLAILESSGWYSPNYNMADPYWFGQGQGCDFLTQKCSSSSFKFEEFCKTSTRGCTVTGRGGGYCKTDTRSDGCKYHHSSDEYDCENTGTASYSRLANLQSFGRSAGSKCFEGTLSTSSGASATSFCFKYDCVGSGSNTKLEVTVGSKSYTCTEKGSMSVSGYKGYITCPDPLAFCSTVGAKTCPRGCMGRGSCQNGRCVCNRGFTGKDCGLNA